jgi:NAD(P)-dependent dehydrogenase (short-subunit alcohol dehydrogenase family)
MSTRTAVVVGAAHGMGEAVAHALAADGCHVIAADLDEAEAQGTADAIRAAGHSAQALRVDVSSAPSVDALVERVAQDHGRIDVLVNTAGYIIQKNVTEMTDEDWRALHSVNLDGSFYLGRAVGKLMREQQHGTMLFIASDRAFYGQAGGAAYASSKAGLIALVKSMALELGLAGVTVNAINPGTTETRLALAGGEEFLAKRRSEDPLGQLSQPEDIAALVGFMVGRGASFITGQVMTTRMRAG